MNADDARRNSEEASGKGSHAELRAFVDRMIKDQSSVGARRVAIARELKYPAHSFEALFVELEKDGFTVDQGSGGNFMVSW